MNIDPIDLIRSSVDESMPHASAERVWARARSRKSSSNLRGLPRRVVSLMAAIAIVALAGAPSNSAVMPEQLTPRKLIVWAALTPDPDKEHEFSAGGQDMSVSATAAYSVNFTFYEFSPVTGVQLTSASTSSVVQLFDIKMTRALASLVGPKPAALIQLPNWTKRYGMQVCALPRLQRVLALPARTVSGDLLSCSFFETYLPSLKSSE